MTYQRCTRCVMDNASDKSITFDSEGHCNYCTSALARARTTYFPPAGQSTIDFVAEWSLLDSTQARLSDSTTQYPGVSERGVTMLDMVKSEGQNKKYDCLMGISGGLDSSYLAMLGHKWGLRILAVHIDDGFDTEISKSNISRLCEAAGIELRTITPDPEQYNALIRAYMEAGVPSLDVPQDNILFAFLYKQVKKERLKYFLSGGNFALECILQHDGVYNSMDVSNIKDINRHFGTTRLNKLEFISSYRKYLRIKLGSVITLRPLNYIDYNRKRALKELNDFCGFEYYGRKHLENILTAFIQLYWLPKKFGVDKRTSHLSSMIVSGQMTREEALRELEEPLYDEDMMQKYIALIKEKLSLSDEDFDRLMSAPVHRHEEFKTDKLAKILRRLFFSRK